MKQDVLEVRDLIRSNKLEVAKRRLEAAATNGQDSAETQFLRGYLCEAQSDLEEAVDWYEKALRTDSRCRLASFHLGRLLSQRGDEDWAVETYEKCVSEAPASINALMNLAILYEDQGRFEQARLILQRIVDRFPHHTRARAFLRDVESSIVMYYDDDQDRTRQSRNVLMDTPISEFELSVRSRNCLKQMNINTLGDLLRTSEQDLLGYKNFGETSLNEVKHMLTIKGLKLGQTMNEPLAPVESTEAEPAPHVTVSSGISPAILNRSVAEMELSVRSRKCLQRLGVVTIADLTQRSEQDLLSTKNFGQTSLHEIKRRLADMGLSLRLGHAARPAF